ncbi:catechol 2,3-dioxygenase-like lactoylglutathione lyase family enzyme [Lachnospiraceae bacterium PM6-15]|uniref:VOC family protein n=1 Tax=Ohessyouella blattaphilus TaxID=2949333 RepID=UPI003E323CAB
MKYVHTNLIAKDWRKLSGFYQTVFGCKPIGPQRDLRGQWLDDMTGIKDAHIEGEHLLLPGVSDNGPTMEIFSYPETIDSDKDVNTCGFAHIAFEVDDIENIMNLVAQEGGSVLGQVVSNDYGDFGIGTFVYVKDPEGNLIELQRWERK